MIRPIQSPDQGATNTCSHGSRLPALTTSTPPSTAGAAWPTPAAPWRQRPRRLHAARVYGYSQLAALPRDAARPPGSSIAASRCRTPLLLPLEPYPFSVALRDSAPFVVLPLATQDAPPTSTTGTPPREGVWSSWRGVAPLLWRNQPLLNARPAPRLRCLTGPCDR